MTVLVGCSGWSYDDWVGGFYPVRLAKKKGEWLAYYAEYFRTVEINSTFYRPPSDFMVNSWIKKAKGKEGFEYSIKMPRLVTHESMVEGDAKKSAKQASSFEKTCVKPLADESMMGCVLLQLSPYFKNEGASLNILESVLDAVSHEEYNYAVEFRHRTWLDEKGSEIKADVLEALRKRNVANVLVDGPGFPITEEETAGHSYIRFHGRNLDIWYRKEKEDDYRIDRYDYLYTERQLRPWLPRIQEAEKKTGTVRIYFNNHARSKSVRNAFDMMDLLSIEHRSKDITPLDQFTIGAFVPDSKSQ